MGHKGPQGHRSATALPTNLLTVITPALQAQAGAASGRQSEAIAIGDLAIPSLLPQGPQGGRPQWGRPQWGRPQWGRPQAGRCGAQAGNGKLGRLRRAGKRRRKPSGRPLRIASINQQQIPRRRSQGPGGEATELDDRGRRCFGRLQCRTQAPGFCDQKRIRRRCHGHRRHGRRRHGHRCHRHRRHGHRRHGHRCHGYRRQMQGQGHGDGSGCFFSATAVPNGYRQGFAAPVIPFSARRPR
jgi:hypothetical protein